MRVNKLGGIWTKVKYRCGLLESRYGVGTSGKHHCKRLESQYGP